MNGCTQLNNIELPEGLERIEQQSFDQCISLSSIIIPSTVKKIGNWTFCGCTQLNNIELREGLEAIGMFAFKDCTALENLRIPSTVKCLDSRSFENCTRCPPSISVRKLKNLWLCCRYRNGGTMDAQNWQYVRITTWFYILSLSKRVQWE